MLIQLMGAGEQLFEGIHPDSKRDGTCDRRPQRIAPANPVPELENMGRVDAEPLRLDQIGRPRYEVSRD